VPETEAARPEDEPNRRLYEAIAFAAEHFIDSLRGDGGEAARRYLERRGIPDEAVERFRIGYAPEGWRVLREAAHAHGIEDEVLIGAGLIKASERTDEPYDRFRDRLMFPIADTGGRVVAFGGRTMARSQENVPKYLNSPETSVYHKGLLLYGLNWAKTAIRREARALIVEGYMDYVSLAARGIENVVAGLGTALTVEQANLIARYTSKAYLLYDSDTAGQHATFRTADALLRAGVHPLVVSLPAGEDPDSLARKGGAAALKPFLDGATDVLERKLQMLEQRGYFEGIEGSRRALDRLLPTLRATIDPALRDIYVRRIADRTGVRAETLEQEVNAPETGFGASRVARASYETRRSSGRPGDASATRPEAPPGVIAAERLLVLMLVRDPDRTERARSIVRGKDFVDPAYRELFEAIVAGRVSADVAAEDIGLGAVAARRLGDLRSDPIEVTDGVVNFEAAVADMKVRRLFLHLDALDAKMARGSREDAGGLMRERQEIQKQLRELGAEAELGYKTSRRYRKHARPTRVTHEPATEEE
jgi:DNA primase